MSKISFPKLADYDVPITYLISHISKKEIINPPNISNKTIEIGSKYSPEFICTPFKYTLGSLIEAIEKGANILIQIGGGCRYGYYSNLQNQILKDLGYNIKIYNLIIAGKCDFKRLYKLVKEIEPKINIFKSLYYLLITINMVKYMDKIDNYIRENVGFEVENKSFENLKKEMLDKFSKVKSNIGLYLLYKKYKKKFKQLKINKPENCFKIGIIGELYTVMEPFSNYFLEKELAKYNISIKRFTNANYLLFNKRKIIKKTKKYTKYKLTADTSSNIYWANYLCLKKYDGIIHIKSSFCTPEIGIIPILKTISSNYDVPIIFMSFDSNTSEVGIKTRIEAFVDMIEMRKNKCI